MLAARIEVTPAPQMRSERTDVFGNRVTRIRIDDAASRTRDQGDLARAGRSPGAAAAPR